MNSTQLSWIFRFKLGFFITIALCFIVPATVAASIVCSFLYVHELWKLITYDEISELEIKNFFFIFIGSIIGAIVHLIIFNL